MDPKEELKAVEDSYSKNPAAWKGGLLLFVLITLCCVCYSCGYKQGKANTASVSTAK